MGINTGKTIHDRQMGLQSACTVCLNQVFLCFCVVYSVGLIAQVLTFLVKLLLCILYTAELLSAIPLHP